MNIKYCLPIIKGTIEEIESTIESHVNEYDYFEIWGGHLRHFSTYEEEKIWNLSKKYKGRLVLLVRNIDPKNIQLINHEIEMMLSCFLHTGELVDIDIKLEKHFLNNILIKEVSNKNLILSYHNYFETPENKFLEKVIMEMRQFKPRIYKISTFCRSEEDAIRLLSFQQKLKARQVKHIVLGMGRNGTITRIFGTLWGNEMIFAPKINEESSAPGQLTKRELEKIFSVLNN